MSVGFLFDFGDDAMTEANDEKRGAEALNHFFVYAKSEYPENMPADSWEEMVAMYGSIQHTIADGLGMAQRTMELSTQQVNNAMERLADQGEGRAPKNWFIFFDTLKNVAMNPNWWHTIQFVGWESLKDAFEVSRGAGEGLISTFKMGKYTMPILIYGGAGLFLYFMAKGFGKSSEKIGRAAADSVREMGRAAADRIRK